MQQLQPEQARESAMEAPRDAAMEYERTTPHGEQDAAAQSETDNAYAAAARRRAQAQYEHKLQRETERMDEVARKLGFDGFDAMERHVQNGPAQRAQEGETDAITQPDDPLVSADLDARQAQLVEESMQAFIRQFPESGVRTVEDFLQLPQDELLAFYDYVSRGLDYSEAYLLTHHKQLAQQQAQAARQAAYNAIFSKEHLQQLGGADAQDPFVHVPDDTLRTYQRWFPTWTDARIRAHYAQSTRGEDNDV